MESKHTPGKWITRASHGKLYVVIEIGHNNYHAVATVHDSHVENAELIASAPALLEENERLKNDLNHLEEIADQRLSSYTKLADTATALRAEVDRLLKENKWYKKRIDEDWYVCELNEELSGMKKQIDELHNSIMTQWEKDYGSIHNEQSMDAYTVSGFIKSILSRIKK